MQPDDFSRQGNLQHVHPCIGREGSHHHRLRGARFFREETIQMTLTPTITSSSTCTFHFRNNMFVLRAGIGYMQYV